MANVTTEAQLRAAVTARDPEIIVVNDISITSPLTVGYALSLKGAANTSLFWASPTAGRRNMIIVSSTGDLTAESLILDAGGRDGTLVFVNGGKFTMNDGVIIRNVTGRTAQNGVLVGDMVTPVGGTFIMNGGLITGIDSSDAVFCGGGTVEMHGDAAISDNMSAGITMSDTIEGGVRCTLIMTGNSRVSNNQSSQGASAGILMGTDILMGIAEGDAPIVTGNRSPQYPVGGWLLSVNTNLTMRYGAKISDNHAAGYGGGLAARSGSTISMFNNASVEANSSDDMGGGISLDYSSTLTMQDNARVSGNVCGGTGGGIHAQNGSVAHINGNADIHGNIAQTGGGISLFRAAAFIGEDASSPRIYENTATELGGGIFVSERSRLDLTGEARISDNVSPEGSGVYKMGALNLSGSPVISDGLFFDRLDEDSARLGVPYYTAPAGEFRIPLDGPEPVRTIPYFEEYAPDPDDPLPDYTSNVPVIVAALTENALIQLEASGYVSPLNVPLVIADKGADYPQLTETDRAAWRIPSSFGQGYIVILNGGLSQVLIANQQHTITYIGLYGAAHKNPVSYNISDLPIALQDPEARPGYSFAGWYDAQGNRINEIPVGTVGSIAVTAVWEELHLSFEPGADPRCVRNMPTPIRAGKGKVVIPPTVPCRRGYSFICWNTPSSGSGKVYFPGDEIVISAQNARLTAQWLRVCGC